MNTTRSQRPEKLFAKPCRHRVTQCGLHQCTQNKHSYLHLARYQWMTCGRKLPFWYLMSGWEWSTCQTAYSTIWFPWEKWRFCEDLLFCTAKTFLTGHFAKRKRQCSYSRLRLQRTSIAGNDDSRRSMLDGSGDRTWQTLWPKNRWSPGIRTTYEPDDVLHPIAKYGSPAIEGKKELPAWRLQNQ